LRYVVLSALRVMPAWFELPAGKSAGYSETLLSLRLSMGLARLLGSMSVDKSFTGWKSLSVNFGGIG
jgi:hypothetical protein